MAKKKTGPEAEASPAPLTTDAPPAPQGFFRKLVSQYGGVAMAATLVLCARGSLADHYYVPSESMLPTVKIGDRIIVNKSAFGLRLPATSIYVLEFEDPDRGDVVVLDSPGDGPVLLKRIVGLPGDELEVRDGRILVNGQQFPVGRSASAQHPVRHRRGRAARARARPPSSPRSCAGHGPRPRAWLIGVTQPRRIAATSVAARVASELGTPLGPTWATRCASTTAPARTRRSSS
jgi:signal peptidase I